MKPKFYPLLLRCIEDGAQIGYFRAFKHDDKPSEEIIVERIVDAITSELYEAFDIDSNSDICNQICIDYES